MRNFFIDNFKAFNGMMRMQMKNSIRVFAAPFGR